MTARKVGVLLTTILAVGLASCGHAKSAAPNGPASAELERLFRADQADRTPPADGKMPGDSMFMAIGARDLERLARVKELYRRDQLRSPDDYFHAAVILQHSWDSTSAADDHLLAHELAIVAFAGGVEGAGYLVAASEDRFLQDDLRRPQRFGTQFPADSGLEAGDGVTDSLRARYGVAPLAELRRRQ